MRLGLGWKEEGIYVVIVVMEDIRVMERPMNRHEIWISGTKSQLMVWKTSVNRELLP